MGLGLVVTLRVVNEKKKKKKKINSLVRVQVKNPNFGSITLSKVQE